MSYPKHHNLFSKLIPVDHNNHVLTKFFSHFLNWILFVKESAWVMLHDQLNMILQISNFWLIMKDRPFNQ